MNKFNIRDRVVCTDGDIYLGMQSRVGTITRNHQYDKNWLEVHMDDGRNYGMRVDDDCWEQEPNGWDK